MDGTPFIPEQITVHLGTPDSNAPNVTVSFPDYIKNVISSEIYPTWPENSIRANIYAAVSFTGAEGMTSTSPIPPSLTRRSSTAERSSSP